MSTRNDLPRSWEEFLAQFIWSHFCTLTYRHGTTRFKHDFVDVFLRRVAWFAKGSVPWFCAIQHTASELHPHVHARLSGTSHLPCATIREQWQFEFTNVRRYDVGGAAAQYISREILPLCDNHDISRRLTPRRQ